LSLSILRIESRAMAYLPLPSPSKLLKRATPPLRRLLHSDPSRPSEVSAIFSKLRQILDGGAQPLDSILRAITDAARVMTGANGIALALRSNGTVVCQARAGEIAPQVGAQLNVDSGISGECLRTGKALRCDDTQTDDRVDPEVCRVLGIRSIAVVPVRGREGMAGILEALSSRPHAFTGEHLSLLQRLAEIGEVANDRELGVEIQTQGSGLTEMSGKFVRQVHVAASIPEEALTADLFGERSANSQHRYWIAGGIALALILMSAVIWISLSDTDGEVVAGQQTTQSQTAPQEDPSHPAPTVIPRKPTAGRIQVRADGLSLKAALQNAATVEPEPLAASEVPSSNLKAAGVTASQPPPTSEIAILLPPEVGANAPDTTAMTPFLSTPAILPAADLAISQVTEAALVHNVQPVYPTEARARHLAGAVVLEATIAEDGSTRDLKIISGPPLLAKAAIEAVRQWRYRPSLLNGKPVAAQKQITIVFKNP
jgi:protein TonB